MSGIVPNTEYPVKISPLHPQETNSTMFTECCSCTIWDHEHVCPCCGRLVIGHDAKTDSERHMVRWKNATRNWKTNK